MTLSPGTRLGPYELVASIGAGGMGEVYRAVDTRLDRAVAIKVLPGSMAADPQARARFDREARAIASLSHPNICALHDIGHDLGHDYLVMELLEGETLQRGLRSHPFEIEAIVDVGLGVADALDAAASRICGGCLFSAARPSWCSRRFSRRLDGRGMVDTSHSFAPRTRARRWTSDIVLITGLR